MPLVHMSDMLRHAYEHQYAVGAFNVISLDFISGIIAAAEEKQAPIIINLAESQIDDLELLMSAVERAARRISVPVAIHLDRGQSLQSAINAINLGCTGVMVDASNLSLTNNITQTKTVVDMAHACGIPVEGKLGNLFGIKNEADEGHAGDRVYTTIAEAKRYLTETGVDCLSFETIHQGGSQLDFDRLVEINQALQIPLAIHGDKGLSDDQFRQLINNGVTKINDDTVLTEAAGRCIYNNSQTEGAADYTTMVRGVSQAIQQHVTRRIETWGSTGKAQALLDYCRPWAQVAHVILYNTEGLDEEGVNDMMAEGRRVLSTIPGVTEVFTGHAVQSEAHYRHCWVVRFTDRSVIESYRDHPDHQQFANNRFRPYAGGRVSIDFEENSHH